MKIYAVKALKQIEASAKKGIWEAHWGCAVIAGALLVDENRVHDEAKPAVRALLDSLLIAKHGFPDNGIEARNSLPRDLFQERILAELATHAREPKEIGHNVIYSAYVLKALDHFSIKPWPSLLESVTLLIRKIHSSGPGWITVNGKNEVRELNEADTKIESDYWTLFARFERTLQTETRDMQLGHLLTHGHAIDLMRDRASPALVEDFDVAYRKRLRGLRLANVEQKDHSPLPRKKIDSRTQEYWALAMSRGMQDHALKYAYSFLDLKRNDISAADLEAFGRILWPADS